MALAWRVATAVLVCSAPAFAVEVFVNGVNVEGLTNQQFEKASVRLDDKGNVHIEAPGYKVHQVVPPNPVVPSETILSKRYFLVTEQKPSGMTEFDIDVFINGKAIRTLRNGEEQIVSEVTNHLRPGRNVVLLQARKLLSKARPKSLLKADLFRVIVGEGSMTDEQVVIEKPLVSFVRTAAETNNVSQEFELITR